MADVFEFHPQLDAARARLWQLMVRLWPGYDGYQRRTEREIPVVILEPR